EAGRFVSFGRWNEGLGHQEVRLMRQAQALRRRKLKAQAVVEGIIGKRGKARIPHQVGIQSGVDGHGRAPLVAWSGPVWPDNAVVVDADGDGLGVAKAAGGGMAAGASIVV